MTYLLTLVIGWVLGFLPLHFAGRKGGKAENSAEPLLNSRMIKQCENLLGYTGNGKGQIEID